MQLSAFQDPDFTSRPPLSKPNVLIPKGNGVREAFYPASLLVVRHAESFGQIDQTAYSSIGDANLPLTEWGYFEQSITAGKFLGQLAKETGQLEIIPSTCLRTQQTADGLIRGVKLTGAEGYLVLPYSADIRLSKQKFGLFDGIFSDKEKARRFPVEFSAYEQQLEKVGLFRARPPGGESIADMRDRVVDFITTISQSTELRGKNPVLVTHGTVALLIEDILLKRGEKWVLDNIDKGKNCQITKITPLIPETTAQGFSSKIIYYGGENRPADQPSLGKRPLFLPVPQ